MQAFGNSNLGPQAGLSDLFGAQQSPPMQPVDDIPWWLKSAAKLFGVIGGGVAIFFGIINFITLHIFLGPTMMLEGLIVGLIEAPWLCGFFDFAAVPSRFLENKPHWIKATLYLFFAVIPISIDVGASTVLTFCFMFLTSSSYLLMTLGKKASVEEMRVKASQLTDGPKSVLVTNEFPLAKSDSQSNASNSPPFVQSDVKFSAPGSGPAGSNVFY